MTSDENSKNRYRKKRSYCNIEVDTDVNENLNFISIQRKKRRKLQKKVNRKRNETQFESENANDFITKTNKIPINIESDTEEEQQPTNIPSNIEISAEELSESDSDTFSNISQNWTILKSKPKAIILDIFGTAVPLTFMDDILYPYIKKYFVHHFLSSDFDRNNIHIQKSFQSMKKIFKEHCISLEMEVEKEIEIVSGKRENREITEFIDDENEDQSETSSMGMDINSNTNTNVSKTRDTSAMTVNELHARMSAVQITEYHSLQTMIEYFMNDKKLQLNEHWIFLQGIAWKFAFENRFICAHIFQDVYECIRRWSSEENIAIYVYSCCTIEAQKLIFQYSKFGDLLHLITKCFGWENMGKKRKSQSFVKLVEYLQLPANEILFISGNASELKTAANANESTFGVNDNTNYARCDGRNAEIEVIQCLRKGIVPNNDGFSMITKFYDIVWKCETNSVEQKYSEKLNCAIF